MELSGNMNDKMDLIGCPRKRTGVGYGAQEMALEQEYSAICGRRAAPPVYSLKCFHAG